MVSNSIDLCADCGVDPWPWEGFMVTDEVWAEAGAPHCLCVGCLEERLDRLLEPDDFPPIPLNDDREVDTVRLRTRKGSGRHTDVLYRFGTEAVLELGRDVTRVAEGLALDVDLLAIHVDNARRFAGFQAEIEAEDAQDD